MSWTWKKLLRGVAGNPWMVLAVGIWVQCVGGSTYDFSVYSDTMKWELSYDQATLDTIATFKDIGANVGIVAGLVYDALPAWVVLAVAGILACAGYLPMWLSITHRIADPKLWHMCLYMLLAANCQTFLNTATIVTCVKNFPTNRGTVVGLMKGFLGLSSAILIQLYQAIYGSNPASFVFMISWLIPAVCFTSMFIIQPLPVDRAMKGTWRRFNLLSVITLALAFYLFGVILLQESITLGRQWRIGICTVVLLIILLPFGVVIDSMRGGEAEDEEPSVAEALMYDKSNSGNSVSTSIGSPACSPIVLGNMGMARLDESEGSNRGGRLESNRGSDYSFLQALLSLDFWLLFVASACSFGSGLTTINNMGQLGASLGYATRDITMLISLWSIWNFLGRFGVGYLSELCLHRGGIARPAFISLMLVLMSAGHVLVAVAFRGSLFIGSALISLCFGAQWTLMPTVTSELFGLQNFGTIFNTISISSPLASYFLSVRLTGYLYDNEAEKQHGLRLISKFLFLQSKSNLSDSLSCDGAVCFRLTFSIMAAISLFGSVVSAILFYRTRAFYKLHIYQKLHRVE